MLHRKHDCGDPILQICTCRIRPFLTREAAQLLVQSLVISRLDYCNSLLTGLPASAIKPLQRIQNAAARLVFNLPKFSHVTPVFRDLHWLPVVARIKFKTMVLAYKAVDGTARSLRSTTSAGRLVPPSLRASKGRLAKSQLFSVLGPQWWNELPAVLRTAESLTQDSPVQSPPRLFIATLRLLATIVHCIVLCCIVL